MPIGSRTARVVRPRGRRFLGDAPAPHPSRRAGAVAVASHAGRPLVGRQAPGRERRPPAVDLFAPLGNVAPEPSLPFVRVRTLWSDDGVTETGHLEEWFACWLISLYAFAPFWAGRARPIRAILFDRVLLPALPGNAPTQ